MPVSAFLQSANFKETKEGLDTMCKLVEDRVQERVRETEIRVARETEIRVARETAKSLLCTTDLTKEKISEATRLPVDEVRQIAEELEKGA